MTMHMYVPRRMRIGNFMIFSMIAPALSRLSQPELNISGTNAVSVLSNLSVKRSMKSLRNVEGRGGQ